MVFTSLVYFFNQFDAKIFRTEKVNTHGGSIRIYVKKDKNIKIEKSVKKMLKEEDDFESKILKLINYLEKRFIK